MSRFHKSNYEEMFPEVKINNYQDQNNDLNVQNYHKLIKMKKLLLDAEKKINNRIKLFQKTSQKILKKKQNSLKMNQKIQKIKMDPFFSRTKLRPKTQQQNFLLTSKQSQQWLKNMKIKQTFSGLDHINNNNNYNNYDDNDCMRPNRRIFFEKINQARIQNAKSIKQDRQRNKIIIEQRKKKQLSRKLQSANIVRRERQNVKIVKQQCFKQKHQECKKFMQEKYQKQKEQLQKLQENLHKLHQEEKEALIIWKKTVDN